MSKGEVKNPEQSGFIHRYYDWLAFEEFVKDLYESEGDVIVEHNVVEQDRHGARRQSDVKITRRTRFHTYVTIVECKRWKEPVTRGRVDILAASIEALGAQKGAIFTTTGFEAGAVDYARGKGIDLFVVRDLTPSEWGLPGRHIHVHLHVWSGEFQKIEPLNVNGIPLVNPLPERLDLRIRLDRDLATEPDQDLRSVATGSRGPNIVSVLSQVHDMVLELLSTHIGLFAGGNDGEILEVLVPVDLLFESDYCQLRLPEAVVKLDVISCVFAVRISQSEIRVDRGQKYDFALVVENYLTQQRQVAHRRRNDNQIEFIIPNSDNNNNNNNNNSDVLENGALISVKMSAWATVKGKTPTRSGILNKKLYFSVGAGDNGKLELNLDAKDV